MLFIRSTVWVVLAWLAPLASAEAVDFAAARDEAVVMLQQLIRIDTSNPPGNETLAAEYIRTVLEREGIASVIVGADPARGNLIARLEGTGAKAPVLLMGHTDVVGVERDKWTVDPFAGEIRDGYLYGRGASDDKDAVVAGLMTLLLIHRARLPLERDIIFLAEASEEGGANDWGIGWLVEHHWEKIAAEFALAEGGATTIRDGRVTLMGVATTEKVPNGIVLTARGTSGHGSIPRPDNPIVRLAKAVGKVGTWQAPMRLNETTRESFRRLSEISPPDEADLYRRLLDPVTAEAAQPELQAHSLTMHSMVRTSISPNMIQGGFRYNVIPAEAQATLDVRALPDEDIEAFADTLRALIDDPAVELTMRSGGGGRPSAPPSGLQTDMFLALERAQKQLYPDATTVPMMLTAATDMAQLRAKGIAAYGIGAPEEEGQGRAHGNDERIGVEALGQYVELVYRAVTDVAVAR